MTIERHLANWHNVWRSDPRANLGSFRTYGSSTSDETLHELHVVLHETKNDMLALEHEYARVG